MSDIPGNFPGAIAFIRAAFEFESLIGCIGLVRRALQEIRTAVQLEGIELSADNMTPLTLAVTLVAAPAKIISRGAYFCRVFDEQHESFADAQWTAVTWSDILAILSTISHTKKYLGPEDLAEIAAIWPAGI
jgi:hypothetical protein